MTDYFNLAKKFTYLADTAVKTMGDALPKSTDEVVDATATKAAEDAYGLLTSVVPLQKAQNMMTNINGAMVNKKGESILPNGKMYLGDIFKTHPDQILPDLLYEFTHTTEPLQYHIDLSDLHLDGKKHFNLHEPIKIPPAIVDNTTISNTPQGLHLDRPVHATNSTLTLKNVSPLPGRETFADGFYTNSEDAPIQRGILNKVHISNDLPTTTADTPAIQLSDTQIRQLHLENAKVEVTQTNSDAGKKASIKQITMGNGTDLRVSAQPLNQKTLIGEVRDFGTSDDVPNKLTVEGANAISHVQTGRNTLINVQNSEGQKAIHELTVPDRGQVGIESFGSAKSAMDPNYKPPIGDIKVGQNATLRTQGPVGNVTGDKAALVDIEAKDHVGKVTIERTPTRLVAEGSEEEPVRLGRINIDNMPKDPLTAPASVNVNIEGSRTTGMAIIGGENHGVSITKSKVDGKGGIHVSNLSPDLSRLENSNRIKIDDNEVLDGIKVWDNHGSPSHRLAQDISIQGNTTPSVSTHGDFNTTSILNNGIDSHYKEATEIQIGASKSSDLVVQPSNKKGTENLTVTGLGKHEAGLDSSLRIESNTEPGGSPHASRSFNQFTMTDSPDSSLHIHKNSTNHNHIKDSNLKVTGEMDGITMERVHLKGGTRFTANNVRLINPSTPTHPMGSLHITGPKRRLYDDPFDALVRIKAKNVLIQGKGTKIKGGRIRETDTQITLGKGAKLENIFLEEGANSKITLKDNSSLVGAKIVLTKESIGKPVKYPHLESKEASLYGLREEGGGVGSWFRNVGYWWQDVTGKSNHHKNS